jgi:hypothetical protein
MLSFEYRNELRDDTAYTHYFRIIVSKILSFKEHLMFHYK